VAIAGAVRGGGRYTYRDGMTLRDLVLLAGGVQESADLQEAEIARLPENRSGGITATTTRVPLDSTYLFDRGPNGKYLGPPGLPAPRGNAPEVVLHPYDNVLILRQPDWALQRTVVIGGEVRYPGRYTLTTKTERLLSIIQRAGGLTPEAYADGIVLFRYRDKTGRIGVDLPRVLRNASDRDNLILMDGDSLYIPLYTGIVKVGGQVNAPTAVAYVPGENMDYYIRAAGGPGVRADMGRAYVTQPDGKIESTNRHLLLFHDVPEPRAGSTVYVPTEYLAPYNPAKLAVYSLIAQVIGSIATILAIARP
jgi:protein involved in polysaccharide export with SLBB domain